MKILERFQLHRSLPISSLLMISSLIMISCDDEKGKSFTSDIVFPDSLVSFGYHVEPLFRETCVDSRCHGGSQPAARLNLEIDMWNSLLHYEPLIVLPTNDSSSTLVIDIASNPQRMPLPPLPRLKQNQIDGVRKWIKEGARNN